MIIQNIWNWIKVNYFSGSIIVSYKADTLKTWKEITENFKNELGKPKHKYSELFIGFSDSSIVIQKETASGLRAPADVFHLSAEISLQDQSLVVDINVYLGEYFDYFFPIWRGFIFIFSVIVISALLMNLGNGVDPKTVIISGFVLFIFNSVCWFATYYFRLEASSLFSYIQRTANKASK